MKFWYRLCIMRIPQVIFIYVSVNEIENNLIIFIGCLSASFMNEQLLPPAPCLDVFLSYYFLRAFPFLLLTLFLVKKILFKKTGLWHWFSLPVGLVEKHRIFPWLGWTRGRVGVWWVVRASRALLSPLPWEPLSFPSGSQRLPAQPSAGTTRSSTQKISRRLGSRIN